MVETIGEPSGRGVDQDDQVVFSTGYSMTCDHVGGVGTVPIIQIIGLVSRPH